MKIKLATILLFASVASGFGGQNIDADFYIRIFSSQFGEGSSGTISVNVEQLKTSKGLLLIGSKFGSVEGETGFMLNWVESVDTGEKFKITISENVDNVTISGITREFVYMPKMEPLVIYSNSAHSVKLVHSLSTNRSQPEDVKSK